MANGVVDFLPGDSLGKYRLLRKVGEGGFGTVWAAEQTEPVIRQVALKIIKLGMDTKEVIARFESERQALAMMTHPGIARVFDAGSTPGGRLYFVMELIEGVSIARFCNDHGLDLRARLEIFVGVCAAVQHAHQKGIIHRDLKPSNILITSTDGKAVPKVIDFGVAKATGSPLTEDTDLTRWEQFIGTPAYMSPEQASFGGLDVDTRSDIYSLGALLYELLTGECPFGRERLKVGGHASMRRMIQETEVPLPSDRVSKFGEAEGTRLTRTHGTSPEKMRRILRRDLDWIVTKAMEKDPERRYQAAKDLALDISRFLNHQTVTAAAPSTAYRFRKFARRNKALLAVGMAAALLLVLGAAMSTLMWQRAEAWGREQERELMRAYESRHRWKTKFFNEQERQWMNENRNLILRVDAEDRAMILGEEIAAVPLDVRRFTFAVYTHETPSKMAERFLPVVAHLERSMRGKLKEPIRIDFNIFKGYANSLMALKNGEVDFMRLGAASYAVAKRRDPKIRLMLTQDDENIGYIFTNHNSGIDAITDLKGETFAFGDPFSTLGSHAPKSFLVDAGFTKVDLELEHLPSHDLVVRGVDKGEYSAGAANAKVVNRMMKEVKVLATIPGESMAWVAGSGVNKNDAQAFKAGLLSIKDRELREQIQSGLKGFVERGDDYYDATRRTIEGAERFDG